jgi:hypothetical protein
LDVYASCGFTTCEASCGKPFGSGCQLAAECTSEYCSGEAGFCSYLCSSDADCPSDSWCAADVDGITKCMLTCEGDVDCPPGHGCGFVSTYDDYAFLLCTSELPLTAPCSVDSECHSDECTSTSGFCTNPCVDDISCADGASCVFDSSGEPYCLVDCLDDLDCEAYPGSVCSTEFDLEDALVDVCWL